MMGLKYFPAYLTYLPVLQRLSLDLVGAVFLAALEYTENGTVPELDSAAAVAFEFIRMDIDRAQAKYTDTCQKNRENIEKRWGEDTDVYDRIPPYTTVYDRVPPHTNDTNVNVNVNVKDKYKDNLMHALHAGEQVVEKPGDGPTLQEVRDFVVTCGLNVDPDYYWERRKTAGWRNKAGKYVGATWQSDLRRWSRYQRSAPAKRDPQPAEAVEPQSSFETDAFYNAAVDYAKRTVFKPADTDTGGDSG